MPCREIEALAALHAGLVRFTRGELYKRRLDVQLAEDVVSDAVVRWLAGRIQYRSERQVRAWFRTTIRRMVVDRVRRPTFDILDQAGVFSLDDSWAHRWDCG